MKAASIVPPLLWDEEYSVSRAIPSSTRTTPAKGLVLFSELLRLQGPLRVLDLGCGNGRNAIYLAQRGCQVTAVDSSPKAIDEVSSRARESGLENKISPMRASILDEHSLAGGKFDFVLDAYTFCHFLTESAAQEFWQVAASALKTGGRALSLSFSNEDEYYRRFLRQKSQRVVTDPTNKISKRLYTEGQLRTFFSSSSLPMLEYFSLFEFDDVVHGANYRRSILIASLRKS